MPAARRLAILVVCAALLVPAAAADGAAKAKPKAFASCSALDKYARKQALRIVEPSGIPFRFGFPVGAGDRGGPEPFPVAAPEQDSAGGDGEAPGGNDFSGTNNQEEGVDEPDFVKTDGKRLYVVWDSTLYVFDLTGGEPQLAGTLELRGFGHELLVSGDRVLALATHYGDPVLSPEPARAHAGRSTVPGYYSEPATRLFEIDVSDPAAPKLLNTLTVEGFYTSARLIGASARVVISTPPDPIEVMDEETIRADAKLSTWIPNAVARDRVRDRRKRPRVVACDDVRRPPRFAGPGTLTLLTLDLDKGLKPVDSDSLMTDAQTVYASKRSLFVASQRWVDPDGQEAVDPGRFTSIHGFDISDRESARYRASALVRGFVLNQFALSEHEGHLRVATTDQPPWREDGTQGESESFVTVLDDGLVQTGRVGGLGKGERIYAVRFLGDRGFVVTFRQVDPLYALDLSDPAAPEVKGELKILGFSSYLHPIGDDLLLGIGQDANEEGQTQGAQVSLFDVSDLSDPKRLFAQSLGQYAGSQAEYDHHAFLYWAPTKLSVLPVSQYSSEDDQFAGAVGLEIDPVEGISEVGRVQHDKIEQYGWSYYPEIRRSLVVRDRLLTVSPGGVMSSTLDTLERVGFSVFPQPAGG